MIKVRTLPNIELSRMDMLNLLRFDAKKYGEAFLCNFSSNRVLYKIFYVPDYLKEEDFSIKNAWLTIVLISAFIEKNAPILLAMISTG